MVDMLIVHFKRSWFYYWLVSSSCHKPRYQHAYSPHSCAHVSNDTTWENLFKHQDISSLVIISIILITCMFDQSVI